MEYCPFGAIKDVLRCVFCGERFVDIVKLLPDCGNSICGICYEELKDRMLKSDEYECKVCQIWHIMPPNGFVDNLALIKMLQLQPEVRALPDKAKKLRSLIGQTQEELERLGQFNKVAALDAHFDRLREEVKKSLEARIAHLRREADDQLKEVERHRTKLTADLADGSTTMPFRPLKRLKTTSAVGTILSQKGFVSTDSELKFIGTELDRFSNEWNEYFNRLSKVVSDTDLDKAHDAIRRFGASIGDLERRIKSETFGGRCYEWKDNASFFMQKRLLGELISDDPRPESASQVPSVKHKSAPAVVELPQPSTSKSSTVTTATAKPDMLVSTLAGHKGRVFHVIFLPDGTLASCSFDETIKIWDPEDGACLHSMRTPGTAAMALASLSNGLLAAGCSDGSVMIWDLAERELARTMKGHRCLVFMVRVLSEAKLASISWDNTIKIWNPLLAEGNLLVSMAGHDTKGESITLGMLSNGHLVTCSNDHQYDYYYKKNSIIRVWDPETGVRVKTVLTKTKGATSLLVLSDDRVAVGFQCGKIKLFDLDKQKLICTLSTKSYSRVLTMVQLPDSGLLVSCGSKRETSIKIHDLRTDVQLKSIPSGHTGDVLALSLSSDGKLLASCSEDGFVKLWSPS